MGLCSARRRGVGKCWKMQKPKIYRCKNMKIIPDVFRQWKLAGNHREWEDAEQTPSQGLFQNFPKLRGQQDAKGSPRGNQHFSQIAKCLIKYCFSFFQSRSHNKFLRFKSLDILNSHRAKIYQKQRAKKILFFKVWLLGHSASSYSFLSAPLLKICPNYPARARSAGPKGLRAESAEAVTGRRCPHSRGEREWLLRIREREGN